jgi:hypothetical protein
MTIRDSDAFAHPGYQQAQSIAAHCALANIGEAYAVYFNGSDLSVHHANATPPRYGRCVCIARYWLNNTVKLSFGTGPDKTIKFNGIDWK